MKEITETDTSIRFGSLTHTGQSGRRENPALHPVHGIPTRVPLDRLPFLHRLRGERRPFVRRLLWYYVAVRLLGGNFAAGLWLLTFPVASVRVALFIPHRLLFRGLSILVWKVSMHARFLDSAGQTTTCL